jgi:RND family efflux transporter MFP subunit
MKFMLLADLQSKTQRAIRKMNNSSRNFLATALLSVLMIPGLSPVFAAEPSLLDCLIEPHEVVDVASRVDGIVDSIQVERGDVVAADQVLVNLDAGVEQAAVAAARERASATADIEANNISMDFTTRRQDRLEVLFEDKVISNDQMDEATTEATLSKLRLKQAVKNRRIAEMELERSLEILERHTIRSPLDGVVVERYLSAGESTKDQPVLRIAQINPLRIEVIVPAASFGSLEAGQLAYVSPEAPSEGRIPALVTIVDKVVDGASGSFRVRLSMPNPDYAIPSGLNCKVEFISKDRTAGEQVAKNGD